MTDLFARRRAVRHYKDMPVEDEKIVSCIYAAGLAPSACNSQPYHFYVASGDMAKKASEYIKKGNVNQWADEVPTFVIITKEHAEIPASIAMVAKRDFREYDIGLMIENFCLEAVEQGLGTCILGCYNEEKLKEAMNIQLSKKIAMVLALGYPADEAEGTKQRRDLNEMITYIK